MIIALSLLTSCVMVPAGRGHHPNRVMIAPILPPLVILDTEPYYYYSDFYYYYTNDRWYYSKSRKGPWNDLPRDRYPKRVRYKGKDRRWDDDRRHDDRRHDDRRYDDRHHDYRR